jgi:dTDP-4-amino-4,6-dideoxygalactose transaminase
MNIVPFVDLAAQYRSIEKEVDAAIKKVLLQCNFILGTEVEEFELMPVHLTGQAADMDAVLDVAKRHQLYVIEDAAQAHGTLYNGRACGSLGTAGGFSFYPGKNLGAYGDGGMVTTNDTELVARLRRLRYYGQETKYITVKKE